MYAKTIISCSFPRAWQEAVEFVRESKMKIKFGGGNEIKHAIDSQVSIILDRHAIEDVFMWKVHPSDPFGTTDKINAYLKEYESGFDASQFDYTYRDRLEKGFYILQEDGKYSPLNQLKILKNGLEKQIKENLSSNRNIAILFNPEIDNNDVLATPCFNEVLIRYEGNNEVSIHTTFRSHDLFQAWESNVIAILTMLREEVIKPCGCTIKFLSEHNYSLHIYEHNLEEARKIIKISISPNLYQLQEKYNRMMI